MYSACGNAVLPALGFPIRESAGHRPFSASPRLIAAVHALHRLLVPRHPPCALPILTVIGEPLARIRLLEFRFVRLPPEQARARIREADSVIPVCWHGCAVFKVRAKGACPDWAAVSQNSTACARARSPRGSRASFTAASARSGRRIGTGSGSGDAVCAAGLRRRSTPGASLERR